MPIWQKTQRLLEMVRFSHTVFALPFALLSTVMALTLPAPDGAQVTWTWSQWLGVLVCMVSGRNAAMSFNRWADRDIDAANPRTQGRHLAQGSLTERHVLTFFFANVIVFGLGTLLFLPNRWPLVLSLPVLVFLCGYSLTKRFTALAHFWLGAALMLAPICVWIAIRGEWLISDPWDGLPPLLIGAAVLLWVAGFDIIYACQDATFDRQAGLHSVPAILGVTGGLRLATVCHILMVGVLVALPQICPQLPLGWIYHIGVLVIAALLAYEHWIVRPDDLERVNIAFFNVNAVVSIGLFLIVTADLLL